jgi:CheY-like chemotaxis protein
MATILVVDDELGIRALLSEILTDEGHSVEVAENAAQARAVPSNVCEPDLVLLDIWMPDVDGVTLLKEWSAAAHLSMPVIMMSGHGTIDTAVEATKHRRDGFPGKAHHACKSCCGGRSRPVKPAPRGTAHPRACSASVGALSASRSTPAHGYLAQTVWPCMPPASPSARSPCRAFPSDRPLREARDAFEKATSSSTCQPRAAP